MFTKSERAAWRFFFEWAGYSIPPGRVASAMAHARAERDAQAREWVFEWVWDDAYDWDETRDWDCCERDTRQRLHEGLSWRWHSHEHEAFGCVLRDANGEVLESLWGITDPDDNYRRVIEAELAMEGLVPEWEAAARIDYWLAHLPKAA